MSTARFETPIGILAVSAQDDRLLSICIDDTAGLAPSTDPLLCEAQAQLEAWFSRRLRDFDLPLMPANSPRGAVLRAAIAAIPYAALASYGEVAHAIGSGPRAIGQACRRNPYPIIIPCHRVIGAKQTIGHYSGGQGIATKRWLIAHEQANRT